MTSRDDHRWRSGHFGEKGERDRYLAALGGMVMIMNSYDAFSYCFSLDALHVERSYVTPTEPLWHACVTTSPYMFCVYES